MFQVTLRPDQFATVVPWLMVNRSGLSVFVHPTTDDAVADHDTSPLWMGEPLPIDVEVVRRHTTNTSKLPAASALVTQEVADFDLWKKTFDSRARLREEAGILGCQILRDADDPALVSVLLQASDRGKLERFLISEYFAARLRGAGVAGALLFLWALRADASRRRPVDE